MYKKINIFLNYLKIYLFPQLSFSNGSYIGKGYFLNIKKKLLQEKNVFIDNFIKENNLKFIDNSWMIDLALSTQIVIKKSKINIQHGKILYGLTNKILKKKNKICILETGTARGFSSVCMAKAINDSGKDGKIYTVDFLPHKKKMYWNCIRDIEGKQTRMDLLSNYKSELKRINFLEGFSKNVLKDLKVSRIHLAFLDSSHNYKDLKLEFDFVSKKQKKGDLILFDDYTPGLFDGVVKFITELSLLNTYNLKKLLPKKDRGYVVAIKK